MHLTISNQNIVTSPLKMEVSVSSSTGYKGEKSTTSVGTNKSTREIVDTEIIINDVSQMLFF